MPRWHPDPGGGRAPAGGEEGSAVLEFVFLSVLLMVPLVYFVLTLGALQGGAYAAVGAADQAAKVFAAQRDPGTARAAAEQAVLLAVADQGFSAGDATLEIGCGTGGCLSPGSTVTATVTLRIPLPVVASLPGIALHAGTVDATASQVVGRFR
ncbi:hypothetical protein ACQCSX_08655 [Pseudarthrobacter sp. P1]|uniref:hypothetical protein n=1 Tax=Pseudarthrobacter sp. P1 TaxID=3418418 RepID=UPI003CF3B703